MPYLLPDPLVSGETLYQHKIIQLSSVQMSNAVALETLLKQYGDEGWLYVTTNSNSLILRYLGHKIKYQVQTLSPLGLLNKLNQIGQQYMVMLGSVNNNAIFAYIGYDGASMGQFTILSLDDISSIEDLQKRVISLGNQGFQYLTEFLGRSIFVQINRPVTHWCNIVEANVDMDKELDSLGKAYMHYLGEISSINFVIFAQGEVIIDYIHVPVGSVDESFFNQKGKEGYKFTGIAQNLYLFEK